VLSDASWQIYAIMARSERTNEAEPSVLKVVVDRKGFEPSTLAQPVRRSPVELPARVWLN
jgi:hypothetical protein